MRFIGSMLLAALLAALLVAPAWAEDCGPLDPPCLPQPPGSVQVNPATAEGDLAVGLVASPGLLVPVEAVIPMPLPPMVEVAPASVASPNAPDFASISIPLRYQDASDVSCGVQALGMALDGLASPGAPPTSAALLGFLQGNGMMYDFGTGVEELAYAAQSFGYKGSFAFHGASLADLAAQLAAGSPAVVALGANGAGIPGHFVTVTGISPDGRWVSYNDPTLGKVVVSADEFLRLWGLQGNAGVAVATEPPATAPDLMPWVALAAGVMALVSTTPFGARRMGVGGALVSGASGGSSGPGSPPHAAPAGFRWVSSQVPVYAMREVQMGYETVSRTLPRTERQRVQVGWDTVTERIPRYRTETYQDGWNVTYDKVPIYRSERYISGYRTWTERRPEYMTIRGRRTLVGYEYVTHRDPIYSTRSVFAGWDYRQQRTPIYRTRTVLDGYDIRTERVPRYEWQDVVVGTQTITERVPRMVTQRVQTGTRTEWELERVPTPTPGPQSTGTPVPGGSIPQPTATPQPLATSEATPSASRAPRPPGFVPVEDEWPEIDIEGRWIARGGRMARSAGSALTARAVMFNALESGRYSVSAPSLAEGTRRTFLNRYGFRGTTYSPGTIANITASGLVRGVFSRGALGTGLVTSVAGNIYDYSWGEHSDTGIRSQEFAVSTGVDFGLAVGTGLAAAVIVAGLVAAAPITVTVSAVIAATAIAGLGIGLLLDHFGVAQDLKAQVNDGIDAWEGVFDNAAKIAGALPDYVEAQVVQPATEAMGNAVDNVSQGIEAASASVSNAVGSFLGSSFGSSDG